MNGERVVKPWDTDGGGEEWVIVSDGETVSIVRSGFTSPAAADAVRREMEAQLTDDDITLLLLMTRAQAEEYVRE